MLKVVSLAVLLSALMMGSALAKGWVKLDQVTQNVLSTMNVAVMLMPNGTIWAADLNASGRIDDTAIFKPMVTHKGKVLNGVVEVVAGEGHVLARLANGEVWAAGDNTHGQLGDGSRQTQSRFVPCYASDHSRIVGAAAIVAGRDHSVVLLENGRVLASGANQHGQLGIGSRVSMSLFAPAQHADGAPIKGMVGVEAHDDYTLLLRSDDTRWLAGRYPKLSIKPEGKIVTFPYFIEF
jgi:alpha-tubulin suppressor-like RCC1 family protein